MPTRVHLEKDWLLIDFDDSASMEALTDSILKLGSFIVAVPRELPMFRKIACTLQLSEHASFKTQLEVIQVFPHGKDRYDTALQPVPWGEAQKSELRSKRDAASAALSGQSAAKGSSNSVPSGPTAAPSLAGAPSGPNTDTLTGNSAASEPLSRTAAPPWKRSRTVATPLTEDEPDLAGNALVAEALAAVLKAKGKSGTPAVQPEPAWPAPSTPPAPPVAVPSQPHAAPFAAPGQPHAAPFAETSEPHGSTFEFELEHPRSPEAHATEPMHRAVVKDAPTYSESHGLDRAAPETPSREPTPAQSTEPLETEPRHHRDAPSEETDEAALERFARLAHTGGSGKSTDYCTDEDMVAAAYAASMSAEALEPFLRSRSLPVLLGLLANRKLKKRELVKLLEGSGLPSAFLEEVAAHKRWGRVYDVQKALSTRAATPFRVASRLMEQLRKRDLQSISERGDV